MTTKQEFDAEAFYAALERSVRTRSVSWKDVSQETGVSQTTLTRMARGRRPDAASMAALSAWAGINPANYVSGLVRSPAPQTLEQVATRRRTVSMKRFPKWVPVELEDLYRLIMTLPPGLQRDVLLQSVKETAQRLRRDRADRKLDAAADEKEAALERLTRIDEEIEHAPQAPAAENRAELLQEDIDSLNMCLDDAGAPREDCGRPLSLWGRVCRMAPQAPVSAWRPIETAPKDGTYILVSADDCQSSWVAAWKPVATSGYRFKNPWQSCMLNNYHLPPHARYLDPTHWMPLPAGPAQEGGE